MSLTAQNILDVKEWIHDRLAAVTNIGDVIPTRHTFETKAAYWATVTAKTTRLTIDTDPIACCLFYLKRFELSEPGDSPTFDMIFGLFLFRESFPDRVDEADTPDVFDAKVFDFENRFDSALIGVRSKFYERAGIPGLVSGATVDRLPIEQAEPVASGESTFFPTVPGHFAELDLRIQVRIADEC